MQTVCLLLTFFVAGMNQAKPATAPLPAMPYADEAAQIERRPQAAAVLVDCVDSAGSIHGASETLLASAVTQDFMPRADQYADSVASVAPALPAATAELRSPNSMPRADEVRFLPCCRERMPCCSDVPACSERIAGCRRGVCSETAVFMPRADEAAFAPLFLPCARQLELAEAAGSLWMLSADDHNPGNAAGGASTLVRTMPRADEKMTTQIPLLMPRADSVIESHAALTPSY